MEEDVYLSDFEWFPQLNDNRDFMAKHGDELKRIALASSKKFDLICRNWKDVHPNLAGYEILVKKYKNISCEINNNSVLC